MHEPLPKSRLNQIFIHELCTHHESITLQLNFSVHTDVFESASTDNIFHYLYLLSVYIAVHAIGLSIYTI